MKSLAMEVIAVIAVALWVAVIVLLITYKPRKTD